MNLLGRRARVVTACVVSAVLGYGTAVALGPDRLPGRRRAATLRENALFHVAVDPSDKVVALTFDDGPDPRWTPTVLDTLARYHAGATFFLVGEHALANTDLVTRERTGGYEIGNHTLTHPDLELLPADQVEAEIDGGAQAIARAGGPRPSLFRPPKGLTDEIVAVVADAERYRTVFWSLTVEKYVNHQDVAAGVRQLLDRVRPGAIILAHDGGIPNRARTMEALPLLLQGLRDRGYRVVDVSVLLGRARHHA